MAEAEDLRLFLTHQVCQIVWEQEAEEVLLVSLTTTMMRCLLLEEEAVVVLEHFSNHLHSWEEVAEAARGCSIWPVPLARNRQ